VINLLISQYCDDNKNNSNINGNFYMLDNQQNKSTFFICVRFYIMGAKCNVGHCYCLLWCDAT